MRKISEFFILSATIMSVIAAAAAGNNASAQPTTSFLVQEVCANSSNQAVFGDPLSCPSGTSARKLQIGESLPYHKIDISGQQVSDSFPISDTLGVSLAVQSYFYYNSGGGDSRWAMDPDWNSGNVYFQPFGGYNIIGTDGSKIFYRGTWDGGGGWQPWWTSSCQAKGWILFPNTANLTYGNSPAPTGDTPNCITSSINQGSNVEWNSGNITYDSGKNIPSIYDFFWADSGHTTLEANYFTQQYGVTRWEYWTTSSSVGSGARARCPHANYTATIQGHTMNMQDCRDWAQIIQPSAPWKPRGRADADGNVMTWPIDPLYTSSGNLLTNTHMGGASQSSCSIDGWSRSYSGTVLNWAWDTSAINPMAAPSLNCTLQFSVPGTPNGQVVYKQIHITKLSGSYTYGATLWAPGGSGQVYVNLIGRDTSGNLTVNVGFTANVFSNPRTFEGSATIGTNTTTLILAMYPQNANIAYDFSGAWIANTPY